jgi:hypothetical protein
MPNIKPSSAEKPMVVARRIADAAGGMTVALLSQLESRNLRLIR